MLAHGWIAMGWARCRRVLRALAVLMAALSLGFLSLECFSKWCVPNKTPVFVPPPPNLYRPPPPQFLPLKIPICTICCNPPPAFFFYQKTPDLHHFVPKKPPGAFFLGTSSYLHPRPFSHKKQAPNLYQFL